jgi:hypothetical protein
MESLNSESRCDKNLHFLNTPEWNQDLLELEILRKAYELIHENTEFFYSELGKAFTAGRERNDYQARI